MGMEKRQTGASAIEELRARLERADREAADGRHFVELAQAYFRFALEHPGQFRLMFGHPCDQPDPERVDAAERTRLVIADRMAQSVAGLRREGFMVGCWSVVHGLAALILDGKLLRDGSGAEPLVESVVVAMVPELVRA